MSRRNIDSEAQVVLADATDLFAEVDIDVMALVHINNEGASEQSREVGGRIGSLKRTLLSLTVIGIAFALIIVVAVSWVLRDRERLQRSYTLLLETRNDDLDAFAGRVAHDLRGLLTTIDLTVGGIEQHFPENTTAGARLRRTVARMTRLIDDLLALSRITSSASHQVGNPAAAVEQIRDDLTHRLAQARGRLEVTVEPSLVRCKEVLLGQLCLNLVDNAVKYRREGVPPEVSLHGRHEGEQYELRVSDNGTGMPPEVVRRVFEPFYRAPDVNEKTGTGLGLSIVKRLVDVCGGTIAVDSVVGRGTAFTIRLPVISSADAKDSTKEETSSPTR